MKSTSKKSGQITSREELIYALSRAAELEHGLICIYLFAAFSMKRYLEEGITEIERDQIRNWESVILEVSKQEMEHLGIVCNMLSAIGGPQHFDRPNLPQKRSYYGTEGRFTLERFNVATIQRFMEFEKPAPTSFATAEVEGDQLVPDQIEVTDFHTVQELYAAILQGFINLDEDPDVDLFIGPPEAQLEDDEIVVGFGNLEYGITMVEVKDLESARQAILEIVEQGEGILIDQLPSTKDARQLQVLYQKVVVDLQEIQSIDFEPDWRGGAKRLLAGVTLMVPVLEQARDVIGCEMDALIKKYTDPEWPESLPDRMTVAIEQLERKKRKVEKILQEEPSDPLADLKKLQKQIVEITKYDVEGIMLSGLIDPLSHYLQFWQVYQEMKCIHDRDDHHHDPARRVAHNPALRLHEDNKQFHHQVTIVHYHYSRQVMELFNSCYETMVQMLIITFSWNRISDAQRTLLINTAFFPFMTMVIRPLSEILTQLPVDDCQEGEDWSQGKRTGPSFEYYIDIAFLPNREPGWKYLIERLGQIAEFSKGLTTVPNELVDFMGHGPLENVEQQMEDLSVNLVRIAENFAIGISQSKQSGNA